MPSVDASTRRQRLLLLFACGVILFSDPLLQIVNRPLLVGGVPLLHGALFAFWSVLIAAVAAAMWQEPESVPPPRSHRVPPPDG
jgi:hypothetical protein